MFNRNSIILITILCSASIQGEQIHVSIDINPESVIVFEGRRTLTSKHCESNPGTDDFDYPGFKFPQLDQLSPTAIHKCTNLSVFNLPSHRITSLDSEFFLNSEKLTYLSLVCNHITTIHQNLFKPLKNLETLLLNGNPIKTIQPILQSHLTKLNDLEIENCELLEEDIDVDIINQKLSGLTRIRYHHNFISCKTYTKLDGRFAMTGLQLKSDTEENMIGSCEREGTKLCLDNDEQYLYQQLRLITNHIKGLEKIEL